MRTLVLSDIHGNIDALLALDEPFDNIILLGDIVDYGPNPAECIDWLQQRAGRVIRARGNHDHAVAFCQDCQTPKGPYRHLSLVSREYTATILDDGQKQWLGEAQTSVLVDQGSVRIFGCHGAPSNHMYKYLTPHTADEELELEVGSVDADIICTGHTHQPFIKSFNGRLLVNVGSIGQPRDGIARICYAVIDDGEVEIKRADYDVAAAVEKVGSMPVEAAVRQQLVFLLENAQAPPVDMSASL